MNQRCICTSVVCLLLAVACAAARAEDVYFPGPGESWEHRLAETVGMLPDKLTAAVRFAEGHEANWLRDLQAQIENDGASEPYPGVLGDIKPRAGPSGVIVRQGYIVAEWGDPERVEMSFGLANSYLSTLAGLAIDRALIGDVDEPLWKSVRDTGFDSPRNSQVTWRMLLNQTSEWEGTLWDKPDLADRRRGYQRTLRPPGTFWENNEVRANRLALSLQRIWTKPLPQVLQAEVMDPIGASTTWQWRGYRNSYLQIGGFAVQVVAGGSHWGGGLWASAQDHARLGYLMLRRGNWAGRRILSERWIDQATSPAESAPYYGFMWWLNDARKLLPSAPESSVFALGAGGNMIWIDADHDLVVVAPGWTSRSSIFSCKRCCNPCRNDGARRAPFV